MSILTFTQLLSSVPNNSTEQVMKSKNKTDGTSFLLCRAQELCVKVEVAVLGSPFLIVRTISVGVKQN